MEKPLWKIGMIYFLSWMAYFPFQVYMTDYMGKRIYGGDPNADDGTKAKNDYDQGVRKGAFTFAMMSIVTVVCSIHVIDKLIEWFGHKIVYFASQILAAICWILPLWVTSVSGTVALFSLVGINFTVFNAIPFSLLNLFSKKKEDEGLYVGVLNSFAVIAQTISNFVAGSFVLHFADGKLQWSIATGGFFSIITGFLVFILDTKPKDENYEQLKENQNNDKDNDDNDNNDNENSLSSLSTDKEEKDKEEKDSKEVSIN
ncbi:sugar transporter [Anaeramoeba ignava]|uniref:Sugar transporter n=1 Tax=Anaeramoeba ignava TaxID=1746090 RepID=A0A9Q0RC22_ANAIG|nr:sugar transporter [Anaeramoeba ignava]